MMTIRLLLLVAFAFHYIQIVHSVVCYQCTDCPEPFTTNYPYVTLVNNTNFLAQCTKTILDLGDGRRLISKGTLFYCAQPLTTTADSQVYCCGGDYCNSSAYFGPSILLLFFIVIRIYM